MIGNWIGVVFRYTKNILYFFHAEFAESAEKLLINLDKFIYIQKVVDTFKLKFKYQVQVQVQPVMLTPKRYQRLFLNLIFEFEFLTSKNVHCYFKLAPIPFPSL